jgi:hypothetical protein
LGVFNGQIWAGGDGGLTVLDPSGRTLYSSRKLRQIEGLAAAGNPTSASRLLAVTFDGMLGEFTAGGRMADRRECQDGMWAVVWDSSAHANPAICLGTADDDDLFLRRLEPRGEAVWTASVAQGVEFSRPAGLALAKLSASAPVRIVVLASNGVLALYALDGGLVWRARLSPPESLPRDEDTPYVRALAVADLNGDGIDEIYVGLTNGIVRVDSADTRQDGIAGGGSSGLLETAPRPKSTKGVN